MESKITVSPTIHNNPSINISTSPSSNKLAVIGSIVGAVISAVVGAYASHEFSLMTAPTHTIDSAETLLGIAKGAIELAQKNNGSPELLSRLQELESQTRAVQANAVLLKDSKNQISSTADVWIPVHTGAVLGKSTAFSILQSGDIYRDGVPTVATQFNNGSYYLKVGQATPTYEGNSGQKCRLVYMGPSPDNRLAGFKAICEEKK